MMVGKFKSSCRGCRVRGMGEGRGERGSENRKQIVNNSVLGLETSNFVNK